MKFVNSMPMFTKQKGEVIKPIYVQIQGQEPVDQNSPIIMMLQNRTPQQIVQTQQNNIYNNTIQTPVNKDQKIEQSNYMGLENIQKRSYLESPKNLSIQSHIQNNQIQESQNFDVDDIPEPESEIVPEPQQLQQQIITQHKESSILQQQSPSYKENIVNSNVETKQNMDTSYRPIYKRQKQYDSQQQSKSIVNELSIIQQSQHVEQQSLQYDAPDLVEEFQQMQESEIIKNTSNRLQNEQNQQQQSQRVEEHIENIETSFKPMYARNKHDNKTVVSPQTYQIKLEQQDIIPQQNLQHQQQMVTSVKPVEPIRWALKNPKPLTESPSIQQHKLTRKQNQIPVDPLFNNQQAKIDALMQKLEQMDQKLNQPQQMHQQPIIYQMQQPDYNFRESSQIEQLKRDQQEILQQNAMLKYQMQQLAAQMKQNQQSAQNPIPTYNQQPNYVQPTQQIIQPQPYNEPHSPIYQPQAEPDYYKPKMQQKQNRIPTTFTKPQPALTADEIEEMINKENNIPEPPKQTAKQNLPPKITQKTNAKLTDPFKPAEEPNIYKKAKTIQAQKLQKGEQKAVQKTVQKVTKYSQNYIKEVPEEVEEEQFVFDRELEELSQAKNALSYKIADLFQ
ncbi:Hypothetical_protein [Hexamita inflata]|uniref:Hypothetical_protein n=1 Tax=Hexamita inflata TaxID=28002 RepID=A0AA86Q3U7_9EUKA|nr:Hypothetical protein HINF_LOCUS39424 [Hexamita inflata]